MEQNVLSRENLETLSTADLLSLADDYGIDIPDNLSRRFIIGELLEIGAEMEMMASEPEKPEMVEGDEEITENSELPSSFNETQISVVLRNPAWAYVYWDISEADLEKKTVSGSIKNFVLRVSYYDEETSSTPLESFDLQVSPEDRDHYILLSVRNKNSEKKYVRIDLVAFFSAKDCENLAVSKKIPLPKNPEIFESAMHGADQNFSKILEISGIREVLKSHYEKYRQLFEN